MGCADCWSFVEGPGQPPRRSGKATLQGRTAHKELTPFLTFPDQGPSLLAAIGGVQIRGPSGPCMYAPHPGGKGTVPGGPGPGEGVTCFINLNLDRPFQAPNRVLEGLKSQCLCPPRMSLGFGSKARASRREPRGPSCSLQSPLAPLSAHSQLPGVPQL